MPLVTWQDLCIDAVDVDLQTRFWVEVSGLKVADSAPPARLSGPTPRHTVWVNPVDRPHRIKNHLDVDCGSVDDLTALVGTMRQSGLGENILNFVGAMEDRRRGRFAEGLAMLERVPESLESARRYHLLGQLHEGAGNYDQAFEAFTRVARLDPSHGADVYLKLGNIHYRRGAMAEAREAWTRALSIDPDNRIVRGNLDAMRRTSGDISEAAVDDVAALVEDAA